MMTQMQVTRISGETSSTFFASSLYTRVDSEQIFFQKQLSYTWGMITYKENIPIFGVQFSEFGNTDTHTHPSIIINTIKW